MDPEHLLAQVTKAVTLLRSLPPPCNSYHFSTTISSYTANRRSSPESSVSKRAHYHSYGISNFFEIWPSVYSQSFERLPTDMQMNSNSFSTILVILRFAGSPSAFGVLRIRTVTNSYSAKDR